MYWVLNKMALKSTLLMSVVLLISACTHYQSQAFKPEQLIETVYQHANGSGVIQQQPIKLILAQTQAELIQGLSGRESLPANQGMLFIFPAEIEKSIWMRGMQFSLDIFFIKKTGEVLSVAKNAQPCVTQKCPIYKNPQADYVIEMKAGALAFEENHPGSVFIMSR